MAVTNWGMRLGARTTEPPTSRRTRGLRPNAEAVDVAAAIARGPSDLHCHLTLALP
jgi:hypothetical protein